MARLNNAPQATGGFKAADHVGKLLLIQSGEVSEFDTKLGPAEGMKCGNVVVVNDDGTFEEFGSTVIFQQVLVSTVIRYSPGEWVSGRLVQPSRYYKLDPVTDAELELLEKVLDTVDSPTEPKPEPAAVGAVAAPVIPQDEPF